MSAVDRFKQQVQASVEDLRDTLVRVSDAIHAHPEIGLAEFEAAALLTRELAAGGFAVERPVADLETAFVATYQGSKPGPKIAFLAEYDALTELGHACGHNIIAASALGAGLALRAVVAATGGTVCVFGTPDEEAFSPVSKGGKVLMGAAGLFDDCDAVLMFHPIGGDNAVWRYSFPLIDFSVRYQGRPAHYTVPHQGVNALESLMLFLHSVNTLKRGWTPDVMFAYTITDGGGPSAITVPPTAAAHITMKAFHSAYLEERFAKVTACAEAVAAMTETQVAVEVISAYKNTIPNLNLTLGLLRNLRALGLPVENPLDSQRALERLKYPGISTDFGDVSWLAPGIHGYCSIGGPDLVAHTPEFAAAAKSARGHAALVSAAKALAMTGVELLADPECSRRVKAEFDAYRAAGFLNVPGLPPHYAAFPDVFVQDLKA